MVLVRDTASCHDDNSKCPCAISWRGGGGGGGHKTLSAHGMRSNNIKNIFKSWLRGIKKEFMLNSAEHEFFPVH